jgi:hypothetical protein
MGLYGSIDMILSIAKQAKEEIILMGSKVSQHYAKTHNRPVLRAGR